MITARPAVGDQEHLQQVTQLKKRPLEENPVVCVTTANFTATVFFFSDEVWRRGEKLEKEKKTTLIVLYERIQLKATFSADFINVYNVKTHMAALKSSRLFFPPDPTGLRAAEKGRRGRHSPGESVYGSIRPGPPK